MLRYVLCSNLRVTKGRRWTKQSGMNLLAMQARDREVRSDLLDSGELFKGYSGEMEAVHRDNAARLKEIVDEFGWPGTSLVGIRVVRPRVWLRSMRSPSPISRRSSCGDFRTRWRKGMLLCCTRPTFWIEFSSTRIGHSCTVSFSTGTPRANSARGSTRMIWRTSGGWNWVYRPSRRPPARRVVTPLRRARGRPTISRTTIENGVNGRRKPDGLTEADSVLFVLLNAAYAFTFAGRDEAPEARDAGCPIDVTLAPPPWKVRFPDEWSATSRCSRRLPPRGPVPSPPVSAFLRPA